MKENSRIRRTVSPRWTEIGFEPPIQGRARTVRARDSALEELENLKTRLLRPILQEIEHPGLCHQLRLAANEALADARTRPRPFLALPCLLESRVREVRQWFHRQQLIRAVTRRLFKTWRDNAAECWCLMPARSEMRFTIS
jgi:hypothetical protein